MLEQRQIIQNKLEQCVEDLFAALGVDLDDYLLNEQQIRGMAPCHSGADNPTAFAYYYDSGRWQCFSNQCHHKYGSDLLGFIRAIKKCSFDECITWSENFLVDKKVTNEVPIKKVIKMIAPVDYWTEHLNQNTYNELILKRLEPPIAFALYRGLDYGLLRSLGSGVAKRGSLRGRFVLPVRNLERKIVGFTGRILQDNSDYPKWLHWPESFVKSINFYNLDRAYETINKTQSIIITEGPLDAIKIEMAGFQNVVALLGTSLGEGQITLLRKCNVVRVYLALDNDEPGRKATEYAARILEKNLFDLYTISVGGSRKDWCESSIDEIKEVIGNKCV